MTRNSKARHQALAQIEVDFEPLLLSCLREAADGRYGLFGQNDHLDPEHRYWNWPEAQRVVEMAMEIQKLRLGRRVQQSGRTTALFPVAPGLERTRRTETSEEAS